MPRFYFDLTDKRTTLSDKEGVEAISLSEALEALQEIVEEMCENDDLPDQGEGWRLLIRDQDGRVLHTANISELSHEAERVRRAAG